MSKMKSLFEMSKKTVITLACLAAAVAVIGTGTAYAVRAAAERNSIGKATAERFALADAGVDMSSALVSKAEFGRENGQYVYEVEFVANGVEYDYTINAADGAVIARDADGQMPGAVQSNAPAVTPPAATSSVTTISAERAKEIALQHASLSAADVNFVHSELDYDDGVQVYDVEFYKGNAEYDYEIDAATGSVLSYDYDAEDHQPTAQPNDSATTPPADAQAPVDSNNAAYIGVDRAKNIAVSHAGVALADAAFQKAKLENDDGRAEYEIEFFKDGIEYDYTIDAVSGTVLEYDAERDD